MKHFEGYYFFYLSYLYNLFCVFFFIVCGSSPLSGFFFRMSVFPVLILLVLEMRLSLPIYCPFWISLFCPWDKIYTATGDRRFWEASDVEFCWSFCLAFVNHEAFPVFHCFEAHCRLQPCRLSDTKALPTPRLPCFYSHGRLTQTCPAILTATIRPVLFGNEIRKNLFVVARSLASIQSYTISE